MNHLHRRRRADSPQVRRALATLQRAIGAVGQAQGNARLPTLRELARRASVNPATMARAVHRLQSRGTLRVRPGGGITVTGLESPSLPTPVTTSSSWEAIYQALKRDILTGMFGSGGHLPSRKELRARFAAGGPSVNEALRRLAEDSLIFPYGRGYSVSDSGNRRTGATLVVVGYTDDMQQLANYTNRSRHFWHTLERECRLHGIRVQQRSFGQLIGRPRRGRDGADRRGAIGYLVWGHGLARSMPEVIRFLLPFGKPIAVTDEHDYVMMPRLNAPSVPVALVSVADNVRAGRDVGRFLLSRGYREVLYFSRHPGDIWGTERFKGLRDEFADAGLAEAVTMVDPRMPLEYSQFHNAWSASRQLSTLVGRAREFAREAGGHGTEHTYKADHGIHDYIWDEYLWAYLEPVLDQALAASPRAAWVCATDEVAFMAIRFLTGRNMVPGVHRSVLGFDNLMESAGAGLTTYDFDTASQAIASLRYILTPPRKPGAHVLHVKVPGLVVERTSLRGVSVPESGSARV